MATRDVERLTDPKGFARIGEGLPRIASFLRTSPYSVSAFLLTRWDSDATRRSGRRRRALNFPDYLPSGLSGAELDLTPSLATKYGKFPDQLVRHGLLVVAEKATPLPKDAPEERRNPAQFRTRYGLTDEGRNAAEDGGYDFEIEPQVRELRGLAAGVYEMVRQRKRERGRKR